MDQQKFNNATLTALSMVIARQEFIAQLLMESVAVGNPDFLKSLRESHTEAVEESSKEWLQKLTDIYSQV